MKTEILFGVGGGIIAYQMGIAKWILENIDNNFLREKCIFGGASAGSITSFFLVCSLYGIDTIDIWFNEVILKLITEIKNNRLGALFVISNLVKKIGLSIEKKIIKHYPIHFLNNKYHLIITKFPEREKKIISTFSCYNEFIEGLITSCFAPFISNGIFKKYENVWCGDGAYCFKVPSKDINNLKVYFNYGFQTEEKCDTINISKWNNFNLNDVWMWGDLNWCQKLFHYGYQESICNKELIKEYIYKQNSNIYNFSLYLIQNCATININKNIKSNICIKKKIRNLKNKKLL